MQRVLTYLILLVFLCGGTLLAIDKQEDKKVSPDKVEKKIDSQDKSSASGSASSSTPARDYNDFVDKNNNGIDDRAEKSKKKSPVGEDNKSETGSNKPDSSKPNK